MIKMYGTSVFKFLLIFFFICVQGLKAQTSEETFINSTFSKSCPMPPFVRKTITISNNNIIYRNILPPRNTVFETHLEKYDTVDTTTYILQLSQIDFDSIANYILNSGLLDIDMDYTKPIVHDNGLQMRKTGGCGISYQIITSEKVIELPYIVSYEIKIPEKLIEFNALFYRTIEKYPKPN